jgi:hypothetical protein
MAALVCSIWVVYHHLERGDRRSRGVQVTAAERIILRRRVAYSSRLYWVGFSCRELYRGCLSVERFWSVKVKVSQLVFFQLRQGLGLVKSVSGCSEVIWNVTTSWLQPVGFSSSMA